MITSNAERTWHTAEAEYDSLPILFRKPYIKVSEFSYLSKDYPVLLILKHHLQVVKSDGLPEGGYNQSLEEFDLSITAPFKIDTNGIVGLIETYAGKRTYYIYITEFFKVSEFVETLRNRFPGENCTVEVEPDSTWRLLNGYARDFGFP
ncbi:MAG: hypothetical protein B0W54_12500 [Cellvibrio sp. 79]|nr:MAG: hypothetical protein B0W54_12500 [Cellvibrio sp. 79]